MISDDKFAIYIGDCLESMRAMPAESVHCCVTSPPYFGLRDYGADGQIGLEATPDEFVQALVDVFREVRRVLRDDGTLWLNLGDSYSSTAPGTRDSPQPRGNRGNPEQWANMRPDLRGEGIKPKDLIGIPWRVAFALQADGWYLRQDIIWHKPNVMPESVRDRCTKAHEYIFLLSKSPRYYFDHEAIREHAITKPGPTWKQRKAAGATRGNVAFNGNVGAGTQRGVHGVGVSHDLGAVDGKRNKRSVWTVPPKPYSGAHFATFPPELIEPCILAGCPTGGTVLDPFGGSGTTAGVALANERRAILCELNPSYAALMPGRISDILKRAGKPPLEKAEMVYYTPYAPDSTGRPMPTAPSEPLGLDDLGAAIGMMGEHFTQRSERTVVYPDFVLTDWVLAL